jgi:prevent-host-death family protein
MRSASTREVQHGLAAILARVEKGEEVQVTRRGRVVARIVPARAPRAKKAAWPDFHARLLDTFADGPARGGTIAEILAQDREDRGEREDQGDRGGRSDRAPRP